MGLVDISEDLIEGTMIRRSDGVSTFTFSVSNPQRKYDSLFTPNDRIVVMMKRLAWVRVFTGLLNQVPLVTAWPMVVPLTASCSLKRLQYWFWDANHPTTQQMIRDALAAVANDTNNVDGGVTNVILTILDKVVGWPATKVHIAQIPSNWFDIAARIAQDIDILAEESDMMAAEFRASLAQRGVIAGDTPATATSAPPAVAGKLVDGKYGKAVLAGEQLRNAEVIYSVCKSMGGSDRDAVIGLITAKVESQIKNLTYGDRDSVGAFQQRPSQGWGTKAQCIDINHAAKEFFTRLLKLSSRSRATEGQAAQSVQRSAFPDRYQEWVGMAEAIVTALNGASAGAGKVGATDNTPHKGAVTRAGATKAASATPGRSTAANFAQTAVALVETYPRIVYKQGAVSDSFLMKNPPDYLDCSSFVQSIYLRTLGSMSGMPRTTQAQIAWLNKNGKKMTAAKALTTTGALLFTADGGHVEISLGDGKHTVGTGSTVAKISNWSNADYFGFGYTVPNLTYAGAAPTPMGTGATAGADPATAQADASLARDLPGFNPNNPIDSLFGNNSWYPQTLESNPDMELAQALTGIRALLNDQPLLPYLMNLFNSQMRSYCSAPNGDLIAWFPDYYGLWGTAAKMVVEPIEVQDFTVMWADDYFVTHQFTLAGQINYVDIPTGGVETWFAEGSGADIKTQTVGIASIDVPAMMWALFGIDAGKSNAQNFTQWVYQKFGARPVYQAMPGLQGPKAEFFSAIYMFMRAWAYQYNADIPLTFMPELYPGMLIQIPAFNFQAYVTTVTHTFHFGQGGGFQTSVNIAAPARMPKKPGDTDNVLMGLPLAGGMQPGHGAENVDSLMGEFE